VRCLSCKYDLKKLTEHRCPECGRAFDPNTLNIDANGIALWKKGLLAVLSFIAIILIFYSICVLSGIITLD
jgi:hypothetical protein